jgi:RNA polymerase sigma factor (sigma-70 family)
MVRVLPIFFRSKAAQAVRTCMNESEPMVELIPRLRRYARALIGDHAAADDLVQDTLERAWTKRDRYRHGTNLRAWLFTLMHNIYIDRLRAAHAVDPLEAVLDELSARASQGDALFLRDLDRAIAQLPPEQRAVLLLITLEDMSYEDAARTLGIPVGTVMSRLWRAREKLRAVLFGQGKLKAVR